MDSEGLCVDVCTLVLRVHDFHNTDDVGSAGRYDPGISLDSNYNGF
jgi:hypothetical protein